MSGYVTNLKLLTAAGAAGVGFQRAFAELTSPTIQTVGTFVGTVQVQVSNDGVTWVQDGANITTATTQTITPGFRWVRAEVTAWTSGTIDAYLAGSTIF